MENSLQVCSIHVLVRQTLIVIIMYSSFRTRLKLILVCLLFVGTGVILLSNASFTLSPLEQGSGHDESVKLAPVLSRSCLIKFNP